MPVPDQSVFAVQMRFLLPNQQHQITEGEVYANPWETNRMPVFHLSTHTHLLKANFPGELKLVSCAWGDLYGIARSAICNLENRQFFTRILRSF